MKTRKTPRPSQASALRVAPQAEEVCLELTDHSVAERSAVHFLNLRRMRDPNVPAARLAEQFIKQNRALMSILDVRVELKYDGNDVRLMIHSGAVVGAIPLISPITARPDFGLVVQPRFPWVGIGPMLAEMGWRVAPSLLRLPLLRRSERRVPIWVLSFTILVRLKTLLDSLDRKFETTTEVRNAPRGRVQWSEFATRSMPRARFLSLVCTFPDLRDDRFLKGAIRHVLERHLHALETQKEHGAFIHRLIESGQQLLRQVQNVPPYVPSPATLRSWLHRPLRSEQWIEGLQAIEWTIEERGLAGLGALEGIPWTMPMDKFFEAWVETVFRVVAQRTGAVVRVGRNRETTHAINWDPPYSGSQKALAPDIFLEWDYVTLIVDAKYKRHWEELQQHTWWNVEEEMREQHRNDLLQVLAYANLARSSTAIVCLAYPCSAETWTSLCARSRLIHRAQLAVGSRAVHIWLTAVPMAAAVERIAVPFAEELRPIVAQSARSPQN